MPLALKAKKADMVIENDGTFEELQRKGGEIIRKL